MIFVDPGTEASTRTIQVADVVLSAITRHVDDYGTHKSGVVLTAEIGTPVRTSTLHRAWTIAGARLERPLHPTISGTTTRASRSPAAP